MNESTPTGPVIEMSNVDVASVREPGRVLVEQVNWAVQPGEYWIIGGLPGSGKSDLLATAAGVLRPARGTHRLFGQEIVSLSGEELVRERLRVGLVFASEGRLFNHLTVAENLALPFCYHRNCPPEDAAEWIAEVLEFTGIAALAPQTPGAIPRNLRPRVALARALTLEPELLLVDEPLRSFDPREARWWVDLLAGLHAGHALFHRRPMTLVVTTDDLRAWADQGRTFAIVEKRRWKMVGGREALRSQSEPLLRELLADGLMDV